MSKRPMAPNPNHLLRVLAYLADHRGVSSTELMQLTGLSRSSVLRLLRGAEYYYGVRIEWHYDCNLPSRGEYRIHYWGVFHSGRMREFMDEIVSAQTEEDNNV